MGGRKLTVLLDTHTVLWFASGSDKLSKVAAEHIHQATTIMVSAISAWEIGMLVEKERLVLEIDVKEWIRLSYQIPKLKWIPINQMIAVESTRLPGTFHGDPADRIIVSTAISMDALLITADKKIHSYKYVRTVW